MTISLPETSFAAALAVTVSAESVAKSIPVADCFCSCVMPLSFEKIMDDVRVLNKGKMQQYGNIEALQHGSENTDEYIFGKGTFRCNATAYQGIFYGRAGLRGNCL